MTFTSPISLFIAVLIAIAFFVVGWMRRPALSRTSLILASFGMIALVLSAGGISCRHGHEPRIAVMVDCSPSTRGASFRDSHWLQTRVHELLGSRPFELYAFADTLHPLEEGDAISEMPADHTVLSPPPVDAVLLFSDGRFDSPPVTPAIDVVIDPALSSPVDARVTDLEQRADELVASVDNTGEPRVLNWLDTQRHSTTAPTGSTILSMRGLTTTETIAARLSPGDLWPENDALSIRPSPPMASQRWWIGDAPLPGWMQIAPQNLPTENSSWLGPAIVVLNNIPADAFSAPQQDRLAQYVRDLGGALVIAGGDHAFAAGHYPGSQLESLSPLSSSPPEPVRHWVLLVDSSGSMSAPAGAETRFKAASDALVSVLRELPKSDLVSIGSFARELRWWSVAKDVQDTTMLSLPPNDVEPTGPTNLEHALEQIISSLPTSPPVDLLILTDAEAEFSDATKLATELNAHHIRLHVLAIGNVKPDSQLSRLSTSTGGQFDVEVDSNEWALRVRRMLRATMPDEVIREPIAISFSGILQSIAPRTVLLLNRSWPKQSVTPIATGTIGKEELTAAAHWKVGTGDVVALAFVPNAGEISAIERAIARPPRDPQFSIDWHNGSSLHVRIDAHDARGYLNDQHLSLAFLSGAKMPIPQTAPGRYEIDLPAPRLPMTASILHDNTLLDRFAVAGRYAREFDAVGNDLDALAALAARSGGAVIEPTQHEPIELPDTRQITSMMAVFAIMGFVLVGLALVVWRAS